MGGIDYPTALQRMADKEQLPEVGLQYESDAARIRLLYEIPLSGRPNRALEIVMGTKPVLPRTNWSSPVLVHDLQGAIGSDNAGEPGDRCKLPFADGSFDLVVMHRTLDAVANRTPSGEAQAYAAALLSEIHRVLRADGVVAGCATNRLARMLRGKGRVVRALSSAGGYRRLLARAGFSDIHMFNVLPGPDAPHTVLNMAPRAIRAFSRSKLHARRDYLSWVGYAMRRIATELTFDRWLADGLFFYSPKR